MGLGKRIFGTNKNRSAESTRAAAPLRFYDLAIFNESPAEQTNFVAAIDDLIAQSERNDATVVNRAASNKPPATFSNSAFRAPESATQTAPQQLAEIDELREFAAALSHGDLLSVARDILDDIKLNALPDPLQLARFETVPEAFPLAPESGAEIFRPDVAENFHTAAAQSNIDLSLETQADSRAVNRLVRFQPDPPPAVQLAPTALTREIFAPPQSFQRATNTDGKFLLFSLSGARFALHCAHLGGIERHARVTRLPNMPAWIEGLGNFNGRILPVINLENYLQTGGNNFGSRYLLIRENLSQPPFFALKVEAAHEIVTVQMPDETSRASVIEYAGETLNVLTYDELQRDPALWRGTQILHSVNEFDM